MSEYGLNDINPYVVHCGYMSEENCPPPGTHFGMRRVKWFELELMLWGEGYIITEGKALKTEKGSLFFRTPGMIVDGISPYKCYAVSFDAVTDKVRQQEYETGNNFNLSPEDEIIQGIPYVKEIKGLDLPYVMQVTNLEKYKGIFDRIHTEFLASDMKNQFILKSLLLQLLIMALEEWSNISKKESTSRSIRNNYPKIIKTKEYIDQNIKKSLALDQLALVAGLSPSFFCRMFKRIIGVSPITYINNCKINMAKQILTNTNMCAKEISLECGFENETYFYTLFKSQQGISPLSYREKFGMSNMFVK
jgi:AraC-like DNA-binding protein